MKMTGVRPHPRTGVLWLRLRTPAHLISSRNRLEALGVENFRVEHHRSLGTRDRRKAEAAYAERRSEIQGIWTGWELLLQTGPQALSYKNVTALAGERAKEFFKANEDSPFNAPPDIQIPDLPLNETAVRQILDSLDPLTRTEYADYMAGVSELSGEERLQRIWTSLEKYPFQKTLLGPLLVATIEQMYGAETDCILNSKRLHVDALTRSLLNWELLRFMGTANRALETRIAGDWRPVQELEHIPQYEPPSSTKSRGPSSSSEMSPMETLTFGSVISQEEQLSAKRLENHDKAAGTFRNYRKDVRKFCDWRGSDAVTTVTRSEIDNWRDAMSARDAQPKIGSKTVRNRLGSLSSVISWAIAHNKSKRSTDTTIPAIFPNGNPALGVDKPVWHKRLSESLTYSLPMARHILTETRKETDPSLRWAPFLEVYHGMRIGEVMQLEKADLMDYEGYYYLMVRSDEIRTTKTRKMRRVPLYQSVVAEGFVEFVNAAPDGRLFPGSLSGRTVAEWIHKTAEPLGGLGGVAPNHGFRHLFEDLATGMEFAARSYIAGRALPNSAEDYGRSPAMIPKLSAMLNDHIMPLIPPLAG
jgi:integrase